MTREAEERMESSTIAPGGQRSVDAPTVTEALRRTAANHPGIVAVRTPDDAVSLTFAELLDRVEALAGGLAGLGVGRGQTVAIMLGNRPEFHVVDLAVAMLGAAPFSIYVTYPPEEIRYVIADAGARVAVVERAFLPGLLEAREELPELEHVVLVDGGAPGTVSLAEIEGSGPSFDAAAAPAIEPGDLLTVIYTSGTTGPPKGVQLTHHNIMVSAGAIEQILAFEPGGRFISWLPAAHIAERMAHHYVPMIYAGTITTCPDPREVLSYLPQVRPTWFFAVPRIWEKLKAGLEAMQATQPDEQREAVQKAFEAAIERVRLRQRGRPVPEALEAAVASADEQMFSKLREMLGLDRTVAVHVGAAPTPVEVLEFFHAIGIELAELWGMSETCGFGTCNPPGAVKIGTVGPPAPGVEVRLADDGELLVRGEFMMAGYRNQPERTAEAIDGDGWLHTGDLASIDEDGYVTIVDRKKDVIINSSGKTMSPANIEAAVKSSSPLIGHVCCVGDGRPYNSALIVLDPEFARQWAAHNGLEGSPFEQLAEQAKLRNAIEAAIEQANRHLARVEQVKRFTVLTGDWAPGGEELTPTMKLKRGPIAAKYAAAIDAMYSS